MKQYLVKANGEEGVLEIELGLTRASQSHTRARRSHIPAPPQGAANPASVSRSGAGLGGCERVAIAFNNSISLRNSFV